jgi:hypothetical protein
MRTMRTMRTVTIMSAVQVGSTLFDEFDVVVIVKELLFGERVNYLA